MRALALLAALPACDGAVGTVVLDLTTAPGSTVLDGVHTLRVTVTNPRRAFDTTRTASGGFELAIEADAGVTAALIVEGFDTTGGLVAAGMSPEFGFGPTDAHVVVYVAPPMSIARAPVALSPPRAQVSATTLTYGAVFAGGRTEAGAPSDAISIYNAFDHTLVGGLAVPVPRTGVTLAATTNAVYLYGGTDADGTVDGKLLRFDTTARPNGAYAELGDHPGFARTGQLAVRVGADRFLVTGAPPVELSAGALAASTDTAALPASGAALPDGSAALFAGGATGLVRFANDAFDVLPAAAGLERAAVTALPTGSFAVVGGGDAVTPTRTVLVVDPVTGGVVTRTDLMTTARYAPAVAATTRHLVVAGGVDASGTPLATAEVFDATTLAPLATLPVTARAGGHALPLPNGQVLLAGGDTASDLLELFTPPPPE